MKGKQGNELIMRRSTRDNQMDRHLLAEFQKNSKRRKERVTQFDKCFI